MVATKLCDSGRKARDPEMNECSYLWDGSSDSWALLHINAHVPDEEPRYLIVDTKTRQALLISDDDVYSEVKRTMLEHGMRILAPSEY